MSGVSTTRNSTAHPNNMQELHQRERCIHMYEGVWFSEISVFYELGQVIKGKNSLFKFLKDTGLVGKI